MLCFVRKIFLIFCERCWRAYAKDVEKRHELAGFHRGIGPHLAGANRACSRLGSLVSIRGRRSGFCSPQLFIWSEAAVIGNLGSAEPATSAAIADTWRLVAFRNYSHLGLTCRINGSKRVWNLTFGGSNPDVLMCKTAAVSVNRTFAGV